MPQPAFSRTRTHLILGVVLLISFGLRTVPNWNRVFAGDAVQFQGNDAWYHMRLVDNLVENFPHYLTFDPYRLYPRGQSTAVLPLLDILIAGASLVTGLGQPSPSRVETIAALTPPVLALLCLIMVFWIGKRLRDPMCGLLAAAFLGLFPGRFFQRSRLGFTDHHVLEVLLVAAVLAALFAVVDGKSSPRKRFWVAFGGGMALGGYGAAWSGAPGLLLVLLLWLLLHYWVDYGRNREEATASAPLLVLFVAATAVLVPFFVRDAGAVRPALILLLAGVAGGLVLSRAATELRRRHVPGWAFAAIAAAAAVVATLGLRIAFPGVWNLGWAFWRQLRADEVARTVSEVGPFWLDPRSQEVTLVPVWVEFGTAGVLAFLGLALLAVRLWRSPASRDVLLSFLTVYFLILAIFQGRFLYYLALPVAILGGWAFSWLYARWAFYSGEPLQGRRRSLSSALYTWLAVIGLFAILFHQIGAGAISQAGRDLGPPASWRETLTWLKKNSPAPFGEEQYYYSLYEDTGVVRPAYGVLSWWDFGYWITRIARRVPVANPSQAGAGRAARLLTATDLGVVETELRSEEIRYLVVDGSTSLLPAADGLRFTGRFPILLRWAGRSHLDYWEHFLQKESNGALVLFYPAYYQALTNRLFLHGGEPVAPKPNATWVVDYSVDAKPTEHSNKVIQSLQRFSSYSAALLYRQRSAGTRRIVCRDPMESCVPLSAIPFLRRVHESRQTWTAPGGERLSRVRTFRLVGSGEGY